MQGFRDSPQGANQAIDDFHCESSKTSIRTAYEKGVSNSLCEDREPSPYPFKDLNTIFRSAGLRMHS